MRYCTKSKKSGIFICKDEILCLSPGQHDRKVRWIMKREHERYPHSEKRHSGAPQKAELPENVAVGRNALRELLNSGRSIDKILIAKGEHEGSIGALLFEARERKIPVVEVEKSKLDTLTGFARHQGVVAYGAERDYQTIEDMLQLAEEKGEPPLLILCDGVEDPHNLGAIIRTAECVGAHGVVIPKRRSVGLTAVVSKASAGAIEYMPIAKVTNLAATIDELKEKGIWVYAADMDGTSYHDMDLKGPMALVLGSEGFGISRLVKEKCDFVVSIPLYGSVNSLNVSNAAAVLLCEAARQRRPQS